MAREVVESRFGNTSDLRPREQFSGNTRVSGVSSPGGFKVAMPDMSILDSVAEWGGSIIRNEAEKQYNKSYLAGQMAQQQGKALEDIKVTGDKWMVEGYHQMDAQTIASTLLTAQQNEIDNADYSLTPEQYRDKWVAQADTLLSGRDPRVQDLVRETLAKQAPELAARHTARRMEYDQTRTGQSAVAAINAASKDASDPDALARVVADNGPLSGLGPLERDQAITQGIVASYQDMNPLAAVKLDALGVTAKLPPENQLQIKAAQEQFKGRIRNEFNGERLKDELALQADIDEGDITPEQAVSRRIDIATKYGFDVKYDEATAVYNEAKTGVDRRNATNKMLLDVALEQDDWTAAARIAGTAVSDMESGGDYGIVGPTHSKYGRALGKYQVMETNVGPWTEKWYGRRLTAEQFLANTAAQDAVFEGQFGSYLAKTGGSMHDALSMWHSGGSYARAQQLGVADVNMKTTDYVTKIMSNMKVWGSTPETRYAEAKQKYDAFMASEEVSRYREFRFEHDALDNSYISGQSGLSVQDYAKASEGLYNKFQLTQTKGDVDRVLSVAAETAQHLEAQLQRDPVFRQRWEKAQQEITIAHAGASAVAGDNTSTLQERQQAVQQFEQQRTAINNKYQIPSKFREDTQYMASMSGMYREAAQKAVGANRNRVMAQGAAAGGYLGASTVPEEFKQKFFDSELANAQQTAQRVRAANPKMTQDEEDTMVQAAMVDVMSASGYVPDEYKQRYSTAVNSPMLDKNGNPTAAAVSAIQDYITMKAKNPRVAAMMLDESATVAAEAIANGAGMRSGGVPLAIQSRERRAAMKPGATDPDLIRQNAGFQQDVAKAVDTELRGTWLSRFFSERSPYELVSSDPLYQEQFKNMVEDQVISDYIMAGGVDKPEVLLPHSLTKVASRIEKLNGMVVVAEPGIDIAAATWGAGTGGSTDLHKEIKSDPHAFETAVRNFIFDNVGNYGIQKDGVKDASPDGFFNSISFGIAQGLAGMAGNREALDTTREAEMDMVPLGVVRTPKGVFLNVSVESSDGPSQRLMLPLDAIGDYDKARRLKIK